jgi:hypothetical protein
MAGCSDSISVAIDHWRGWEAREAWRHGPPGKLDGPNAKEYNLSLHRIFFSPSIVDNGAGLETVVPITRVTRYGEARR